jgi:hypothetical protein
LEWEKMLTQKEKIHMDSIKQAVLSEYFNEAATPPISGEPRVDIWYFLRFGKPLISAMDYGFKKI